MDHEHNDDDENRNNDCHEKCDSYCRPADCHRLTLRPSHSSIGNPSSGILVKSSSTHFAVPAARFVLGSAARAANQIHSTLRERICPLLFDTIQ